MRLSTTISTFRSCLELLKKEALSMKVNGATTLRLQSCYKDLEVCQSMYDKIFGYSIDPKSTDEEFELASEFITKTGLEMAEVQNSLSDLSSSLVKKEAPSECTTPQSSQVLAPNSSIALKPDVLTLEHTLVEFENWNLHLIRTSNSWD